MIDTSLSFTHLPKEKLIPQILLVEDSAEICEYVKQYLERYYQIEVVNDRSSALAAIAQRLPDLVLTDVMLPALDGVKLLRQLRNDPRTENLPNHFAGGARR